MSTATLSPQTDRAGWLEERRGYIGATDTASILGLGFSTPLGVYNDKMGLPNPEPDEDAKLRMEIGLALEPVLGQFFTLQTNIPLKRIETLRHPQYPFIGANLDFVSEDGKAAVETKTYGIGRHSEFGEEGTDEIPDGYHIQLTKQVGLARLNGCDMIGGHLYALNLGTTVSKIFTIMFDEEFFDALVEKDVRFWKDHVEPGIPPKATAKDEDRVRLIYPDDNGEAILAAPEDDDLVYQLLQLSPERKAVCEKYDTLKVQLIERMGPYERMTTAYGNVTYKTTPEQTGLNVDALLAELGIKPTPDLVAKHTITTRKSSRRLYLPRAK